MDVKTRRNMRGYHEVLRVVSDDMNDGEPYLTYHRWTQGGYCLFAFDLTSDGSAARGTCYKTVRRSGDIDLEVTFATKPLDAAGRKRSISVVALCEFDSTVELCRTDNKPIMDW
jgi:hypothetical protein